MNNLGEWQKGNDAYLQAALAWLRLRLARLVGEEKNPSLLPEALPEQTGHQIPKRRFFQRQSAPLPPLNYASPVLLPAATYETITNEQLRAAAEAMNAAAEITPPPTLLLLGQRFALSPFEREVLLLCAAMELDTSIAGLCARAQNDARKPYPTFALALALFDDPAWESLSPERPLRYWQLIEIFQPQGQALNASALHADERIVSYLKGLNYLDDRLSPLLFPLDSKEGLAELPDSQLASVEAIVRTLKLARSASRFPVIHLLGADTSGKLAMALRVAATLDLLLYRLPAELLPTQVAELETISRLWHRESILLPIALYLDAHDFDRASQSERQSPPLHRFLSRSNGIIFLNTRDVSADFNKLTIMLDVAKPTTAEQEMAWGSVSGLEDTPIPARLAAQFNLNLATIGEIGRRVLAEAADDEIPLAVLRDRLWNACLNSTRPQLDQLAQRIEPKADWNDIVLPPVQMNLLRQIADQVDNRNRVYEKGGFALKMNRGLGINALFAGESGTGKTMAAEVIANELQLNLYRIDLSAVVSKYIGETEKNLRRLFDEADNGGAILCFDEADSLFSKRSEVKDSHDRYANIEINYLLQRMEAYRGLAVLATNMKSALDTAFLRRLRFIIDFPFPGPAERREIWRGVFPAQTRTENLDFDRLARLNLTGGNIHNVALNAAFMAARENTPVTMALIMEAAKAEFRKVGLPIHESDFRLPEKLGEVA